MTYISSPEELKLVKMAHRWRLEFCQGDTEPIAVYKMFRHNTRLYLYRDGSKKLVEGPLSKKPVITRVLQTPEDQEKSRELFTVICQQKLKNIEEFQRNKAGRMKKTRSRRGEFR